MNTEPLTNYDNPRSLGSRLRAGRIEPLKKLIRRVHAAKGAVSILDAGGRETYWRLIERGFLEKHRAHVTLVNLPCDLGGGDDPMFTHAAGDACQLNRYPDHAFDIVHSNSVIEHVGNWHRVDAFAREARRLAPNLFVQTPYFWFPLEPHFIKPLHHWLPKPLRASMWMRFRMGHRGRASDLGDAMRRIDDEPYLLDQRMLRFLFPDCRILKERFLGLTKSLIAYREADPA